MRRFLWSSFAALLLACVAVASSGGATQAEARWVITDLGTLERSGTYSLALDINEKGQIVGWSSTKAERQRAFVWENGKMTDLGTLPGGRESEAVAINDRGQVVGWAETGKEEDGEWHAFLWQEGKMRDLGTLGGEESEANDINRRGQVVGEARTKAGWPHAFLWERGKMRDLGTLGGVWSRAEAINDRGQVVGISETRYSPRERGGSHIFLWEKGRMIDLGPPTLSLCLMSEELAINERDQVVATLDTGKNDPGSKYGDESICHAFLLQNGKLRDLTPGAVNSAAEDIDDHGQVVGAWWKLGDTYGEHWDRAVLWQDGKRMIRLGSLNGASRANAINERGKIVGWSDAKGGGYHAVLWTLKR